MRNYVSFSQINTYCQCGYKYYLHYAEDIILPPSPSLILGSAYHSTVETDLRQKISTGTDLPLSEMEAFFANFVEAKFKEEILLSEDEKERGKSTVMDSCITRGRAALKAFSEDYAPSLQPLEVEKEFNVSLRDDLPPLKGYIDLITTDMSVVDHKTAKKSPSANEADNSLQVSAYALGFKALYGYIPEELELQYTVVPESMKVKTVPLKTKRTQDQIDRFVNRVVLVVDGIRKGVFIPPEQTSWACGYCGYKDLGYCPL